MSARSRFSAWIAVAAVCIGGAAFAAPVTPKEAVSIAVNQLTPIDGGYRLEHPRHVAEFTAAGVRFTPRRGGPTWSWQLDPEGSSVSVAASDPAAARPTASGARQVSYHRGVLEERYLLCADHVEQQFVIAAPLAPTGADLVIAGRVECPGMLESDARGWMWRTDRGVVSLGQVHVYDARGHELPASLQVEAGATRLLVDGSALAEAAYPVTIDPEIGTNDFRLSDLGLDGDFTYDGVAASVAYDPLGNQYLVVWEGDDDTAGLGDGQYEIFGQRIDATTGSEIGLNDFRISDLGPDGDPAFDAAGPSVCFNSAQREFFVVWSGDDLQAGLANGESEIFGQRINALTGAEVGANDFRISDMGPDGNELYDALHPDVAYNPTQGEYLVVWEGDDNSGLLVEGETEIFGQRIHAATGAEIGTNDFRISDLGPDGNALFDGDAPAVAYASGPGEYLVVWEGDDNAGGLVEGEFEIFGQRIAGATGAEVGTNDFRLSDMGGLGLGLFDAFSPDVAYASGENEYLVVWSGDDNTGNLVDGEFEIYGQRVAAATGAEVGMNDLRISDMGGDGDPVLDGLEPAVAYNATNHEYLVVWDGDDAGGGMSDGEYEIWGQRLNATNGAAVGTNDFLLTDMGTDGNFAYAGLTPAVAYAGTPGQYLVVWEGDDDTVGLADDEFEIWGQRVIASSGIETGVNDFRLSDMGPDTDIDWDADLPCVAYNPDANEYLVVWQGDDNVGGLVDGETEIFGQRIDAASGAELGGNDFRISDMGPNGDPAYDAQSPAVTYNLTNHEYLVVWAGEDNTGLLINGEFEIYGQRLDGATAAEVGTNDFRISDMGPDGDALFDAGEPALTYNATANEYLVIWEGDDNTLPLVEGETEIFGQRLAGATGVQLGTNDFRVSDMGPDGNFDFDAAVPAVAWNSTNNQYLVVWAGEDNTGLLVNGEFEICGQRLDAVGAQIGTNDIRLSDMGPDGDANFDAFAPAVAYDSFDNQYLVVWEGEDDVAPLVAGEFEIFGQRLDAAGLTLGTNDFRISDMGPDGDPLYDAQRPAVTYSDTDHEYFVVWEGDDNTGLLADGENEVFAQRLTAATGVQIGDNDFRLSDLGPDGDGLFDAHVPAVVFAAPINQYLIVWIGDDDAPGLGANEFEVYGQRFINLTSADAAEAAGAAPRRDALSVSPNPVSAVTRLALELSSDGPVELALFDVGGREVWRRTGGATAGIARFDLDASRLPNGVYLARAVTRGAAVTQRVVVAR